MSASPQVLARAAPTDWFGQAISAREVKRRSVLGVTASAMRRVASYAVRFGSMLVLARLLTPADYGVVGMVVAVTGAAGVLSDLQISSVLVRARQIDHAQASNLYWIRLAMTLLVAGTIIAAAPLIAGFYGDPRVQGVAIVLGAGMIVASTYSQHTALLRRNLRVGELARVEITAAIATAAVSVLGAYHGLGHWALVSGIVAAIAVRLLLLWTLCDWRPSAPDRTAPTRPLLDQSLRLSLFSLLSFVAANISNVLIGKGSGADAAGHYTRAAHLNGLMLNTIWEPLGVVASPAMAQLMAQPARMTAYYYKITTILVIATMPVSFVGLVLPHEMIGVLLGPQWDLCAEILRVFSIGVLPTVLCYTASWVFFSVGDAGATMRWGLIGWPIMILGVVAGAPWGPQGVAIATVATTTIMTVPCLHTAFQKTALRLAPLFRSIARPVAASAIAGVVAVLVLLVLPHHARLLRLIAGSGVFMAVYGALLWTVFGQRELIVDILQQLRTRKRRPQDDVPEVVVPQEPPL